MHHSENNATIHAMTLSPEDLERYGECLAQREKSRATLDKYVRDVRRFFVYLGGDGAALPDRQRQQYVDRSALVSWIYRAGGLSGEAVQGSAADVPAGR